MCEATILIDAIILVLFTWASLRGINVPGGVFNITPLPTTLALISGGIATASYFWASEKNRTQVSLAAYLIAISAIITLIIQTGDVSSPFVTLWLIASIFSGVFGVWLLGLLAGGIIGIFVWLGLNGDLDAYIIFTLLLAGLLPILMSFVLWHGKSSTEKTKERAYYDLANELDQVANKSEVVINAISDGVIAINNSGQIELINPAAEYLVGWAHQDAINLDYKSVMQLMTKDGHELDKSNDPVFEVLTTNQIKRRNDLQLQTNSGRKMIVELVVSPIGRIGAGAIIVFRDVTKQQAEEHAQAEFISTASHEMRTPVASIEGYLGLALNPATATIDEKARDYITKAHESAQHLGRLFQDLLDITKADDGRLQNNPKVIDVVSFTQDIVGGLKPKADEKKLRLFFKAEDDRRGSGHTLDPIFYVNLDADHLREVIANLVENAIKYTLQGEVIIDVTGNEEHVIVSIRDSGIGIPAEDIPHLFQKFYRVDNTDTREIGGTGLGLYLCRRLIEAMGGRIWVESEYKKGSTFSIEVPRISHADAEHLIETGGSKNAVPTEAPQPAVDPELEDSSDTDALTAQQRQAALATPIIVSKSSMPLSTPAAVVAAPEAPASAPVAPQTVDPLVGGAAAVAPQEELHPKNPMVLPPAWQDIKADVQKATAAPAAAPVSAEQQKA